VKNLTPVFSSAWNSPKPNNSTGYNKACINERRATVTESPAVSKAAHNNISTPVAELFSATPSSPIMNSTAKGKVESSTVKPHGSRQTTTPKLNPPSDGKQRITRVQIV
jgi:hypothetical protein